MIQIKINLDKVSLHFKATDILIQPSSIETVKLLS